MKRIFGNGSYANVTATLALVIALGGTSYAAIKLPKNSVTSATVKDRSLLKKDFRPGQLPAGKTRPGGARGPGRGRWRRGGSGTGVSSTAPKPSRTLVPGTADQVDPEPEPARRQLGRDREVRRRERQPGDGRRPAC